jgi:hypothetical protein
MNNYYQYIKGRKRQILKSFVIVFLIALPFTFLPLVSKGFTLVAVIDRLAESLLYALIFAILLIFAAISQEISKPESNASSTSRKEKSFMSEEKASEIINDLANLGYFKYVNLEHLETIKASSKELLIKYGQIGVEEYNYKIDGWQGDYRLLGIGDGEELHEDGGVEYYFNHIRPVLEKMGVKVEEYYVDKSYIDRFPVMKMVINSKVYIFTEEEDRRKSSSHSDSIGLFVYMINDLLLKAESVERLYALPEEGLIFLTPELYQYLRKSTIQQNRKPHELASR